MDISITHFKSIFDNKTNKVSQFKDFQDFRSALYHLAQQPRANKKDATLISPAYYVDNTTRANDNVIGWSKWCAVDIDDHDFKGDLLLELTDNTPLRDMYFVCYSTASSTVDKPKFRLVFPLTSTVEACDIKAFWYALNTEIGNLADKQTKDLSRMYYIPGLYNGANNFIFTHTGNYVDPMDLMKKHQYVEKTQGTFLDRLPKTFRQEVIEYRKNKMDNIDFHWSSYKDCPFFPKQLSAEYRAITGTGWYHKMYQIMVSVAGNAINNKYPITPQEITLLCRQLDDETGGWYKSRPLEKEADRAIEYCYKNAKI
jgi:hypothetical protein|tara:strand:- start:1958 stop:2896 length:939 start_codon:yes stop_codon:yes gene_type:complete